MRSLGRFGSSERERGSVRWSSPFDDGTRRRSPAPALGAVTTVALAATLAGCSPGDADAEPDSGATVSPAVSESPSASAGPEGQESSEPEDPQAIIEQRTADAIERYKEYSAIKNKFERRGEGALAELEKGGYVGSHAVREYEGEWGDALVDQGVRQTGNVIVDDMTFVEYEGDPTEEILGHEIQMTACLDLSGIDFVDENNESQVNQRQDHPKMDVTMRGTRLTVHGEETSVWAVASDSVAGEEC